MNYPVWDLPLLGGSILIAVIAVLHVFVAHFAIGGGLFLVLTEARAYRENDPGLLAYVKTHSLFFALVVLVFGAVSGAGIWWTIGLIQPTATSTLIHTFVWAWAIEWVFFLVEIAAAYVYYYGWDRLERRTHLTIGWIYFGAAWLSLFVINGIVAFMLTPGRWLNTRDFFDAFFNPTMLPSLVMRTASTVAIAGLYAMLTATTIPDDRQRARTMRWSGKWVLVGTAAMPLAAIWYLAVIPPLAREIPLGAAPAVTIFSGLSLLLSLWIVVVTFFGPYRHPHYANVVLVAILGFLGLGVTGVTEWVREAVRKPYIIYGYMYANSIRVADAATVNEQGILASAKWVSVRSAEEPTRLEAGRQIFRTECSACHTIDGYNGIRVLVKGWREDYLAYQVQHLNELKGFMPPFTGTEAERLALAHWLCELGRQKPFSGPLLEAHAAPADRQAPAPGVGR